jgi:hypothetical protein
MSAEGHDRTFELLTFMAAYRAGADVLGGGQKGPESANCRN